ncbi:helix-turn-helix domain-containing protein [Acinetobacter sp. CIP 102637]|uniref:helix-turn-helix domain-containing protein n=1 Tax=Acinetobacter sp. CIP 102637 TaxID=1144669 RepID=UPI0003A70ED5|nr:helix-turn-helix transcriptional regulator [Acinetobacter sp. CIP 102637]
MNKIPNDRKEKINSQVSQTVTAIRLAELRKQQHITQKEIAKKMNVSQASISQLENQGDVQLSTLLRYVHALGGSLAVQVQLPDGSEVSLLTN